MVDVCTKEDMPMMTVSEGLCHVILNWKEAEKERG